MNDEPPLLDIRDDGEIYIHEDAPDDFVEDYGSNPDEYDAVIEYAYLQVAAYGKADTVELGKYRQFRDEQLEAMENAVESGDIEEAQKRKSFADGFERVGEKYFEAIKNDL